jgi:hypothetical protein
MKIDGPSTTPTEYAEKLRRRAEKEKDRAVKEAQRLAKDRVPVDTGALRDDISVDLEEDTVYNTLPYADDVNFGTDERRPTFYLTDAALDAFRRSVERLER